MVIIDEHDVGKTREEVLMDLIYEATKQRIPLDKVVFGHPMEVDKRKDLETDPNTFIPAKVNPQYDSRYSADGSGFMYRRRNIYQHCLDCSAELIKPTQLPFKISDVLDQINAVMPYPIDVSDIVNFEYSTLEEIEDGIMLKAHPHSLLWCKEHSFRVDTGFIDGDALIGTPILDGFNEYVA